MRRKSMVLLIAVIVSLLAVAPAMAAPAPSPVAAPGYHMVRVGETLFSIGRLYGVNPWAIASANHLHDASRIYAGQWLYIPRYQPYPQHPQYPYPQHPQYPYPYHPQYPSARYHCVRYGETLHSIGRMYGMNPWVIASANGIYNLNYIYAGQRLVIPYHG